MPDDPLAFDTERCEVEAITRIPPCENLLIDPTVPEPPPEITDCEHSIESLAPEPPCPTLATDEEDNIINYGGTFEDNPPAVRFEITPGGCCDFTFNIEIDIPCPDIEPEYPEIVEVPFIEGPSELRFGFVKNLETCDFDLTIDLDIHCPEMLPPEDDPEIKPIPFLAPGEEGQLTYYFVKVDDCDYELVIDIEIPCPEFTLGIDVDVTTLPPGSQATGSATVTQTGCLELDFGFSFGIPAGPQGFQGFQGAPGSPGSNGNQGFQGPPGKCACPGGGGYYFGSGVGGSGPFFCDGILISALIQCNEDNTEIREGCLFIGPNGRLTLVNPEGEIIAGG